MASSGWQQSYCAAGFGGRQSGNSSKQFGADQSGSFGRGAPPSVGRGRALVMPAWMKEQQAAASGGATVAATGSVPAASDGTAPRPHVVEAASTKPSSGTRSPAPTASAYSYKSGVSSSAAIVQDNRAPNGRKSSSAGKESKDQQGLVREPPAPRPPSERSSPPPPVSSSKSPPKRAESKREESRSRKKSRSRSRKRSGSSRSRSSRARKHKKRRKSTSRSSSKAAVQLDSKTDCETLCKLLTVVRNIPSSERKHRRAAKKVQNLLSLKNFVGEDSKGRYLDPGKYVDHVFKGGPDVVKIHYRVAYDVESRRSYCVDFEEQADEKGRVETTRIVAYECQSGSITRAYFFKDRNELAREASGLTLDKFDSDSSLKDVRRYLQKKGVDEKTPRRLVEGWKVNGRV
eukprot:GHVU01032958.1.p1 GENE.GHVU01032958.1~~GHVU01032958.1.p1  ORF type:complete len:403 (-),score=50.16 GHVU01032958.1:1410-2618(-)